MNKCIITTKQHQNRAGKTNAGSQKYCFMHRDRKYTPEPKVKECSENMQKRASKTYVDGNNLQRIACHGDRMEL
jgi:hypothetical protein